MPNGEAEVIGRLARPEWAAVVLAAVIAHGFLAHELFYPSAADAKQYANIGREMAERGVLHRFTASDVRTYGYPFVLSFVHRGAVALQLPFDVALFGLQFPLYMMACLLFRNALFGVSALSARVAFCGLLVNHHVLVYASQSLTESLSLTLLLIAGACWVEMHRRKPSVWLMAAGSLVIGIAVMVRPANVFMVVAWVAGAMVIGRRRGTGLRRTIPWVACIVAGVGLPAIPQLLNNVREYGRCTPLLVADLGRRQQVLGIQNIKYATAVRPLPTATVFYRNPLWPGTTIDDEAPWRWYVANPGRGALTLALHTFNLTDQDLLFTYSRDLDPWYRRPLGLVNHAVVGLGLIGLFLVARRASGQGRPAWADAFFVLVVMLVANWAMYAWTAVEMRYGSVLLLVLFPLAGYAATEAVRKRDVGAVIAAGIGLTVYVALALLLSHWVRDQAPLIRDAGAARQVTPTDRRSRMGDLSREEHHLRRVAR